MLGLKFTKDCCCISPKREQLDRNILNDANLLIVLDTDMFSFWNLNIDLSGEIDQF